MEIGSVKFDTCKLDGVEFRMDKLKEDKGDGDCNDGDHVGKNSAEGDID